MSILITGGGGFLADNLASAARELTDEHVYLVGRKTGHGDLSDISYVKHLMDTLKPDNIWHCAAKATIKPDGSDPSKIIDDNIKAVHNLAYCAPQDCFIKLASSIVVYGDGLGVFRMEETSPCQPTSVYGATKLAAEEILRAYERQGKIRALSLRMGATVGPHLTHGIIYDFIRKLKSDSPTLQVLGDEPGARKPFSHYSDVSIAFIKNSYGDTKILNIVPDDVLTVKEVAKVVMDTLQIHKPIEWLGSKATWAGDNKVLYANNNLFKKIFGITPLDSTKSIELAVMENK